ncbi:hypothetical protein [Streptomyces sp. NPDC057889]|uniref:hypothetical protein n=1 Tax=unclassified Streptomyces TaxID=2593676 RepID=UPI0036A6B265
MIDLDVLGTSSPRLPLLLVAAAVGVLAADNPAWANAAAAASAAYTALAAINGGQGEGS